MDSPTSTLFDVTEIKQRASKNPLGAIIVLIIGLVVLYYLYKMLNSEGFQMMKREGFSPGVFSQIFARDEQDLYQLNNINQTAGGNFELAWNQPTRIAGTAHLRGATPSCLKDSTLQPTMIPDGYTASY